MTGGFSPEISRASSPNEGIPHVPRIPTRRTGRTRMVVTGEFIPEEDEPQVSAINVGTLKATTSDDDKYCMLDSGANVMVVPLMRDMKGEKTMCSLCRGQ